MSEENIKFNLFLLADYPQTDYVDLLRDDIIKSLNKENGYRLDRSKLNTKIINGLKGRKSGEIFLFHKKNKPLPWHEFINTLSRRKFRDYINIKKQSLVFIETTKGLVVISFGKAASLLDDKFIVKDFGLKVASRELEITNLGNIESMILGEGFLNTRKRATKFIPVRYLLDKGFYSAVKNISGKTIEEGWFIGGETSVIFSGKINLLEELIPTIERFVDTYYSEKASLDLNNNLIDVSYDKKLIDLLNHKLYRKLINLKNKFSTEKQLNGTDLKKIDFSPNDSFDTDKLEGYFISGVGYKSSARIEFLDKYEYLTKLAAHLYLKDLDEEESILRKLRQDKIFAYFLDSEEPVVVSSVYNALSFETSIDNKMYVLLMGKWFNLNKEFYEELLTFIDQIPEYENQNIDFEEYNKAVYSSENDYNAKIAIRNNINNFDTREAHYFPKDIDNLKAYGIHSKSEVEVCDLLYSTLDKTHFIHVKRETTPNKISHLFAQGYAAAELLVEDKEFLEHTNKHISQGPKLEYVKPEDIEIVFGIVMKKSYFDKKQNSKLFTLLNMLTISMHLKGISAIGYKYSIKRILDSTEK